MVILFNSWATNDEKTYKEYINNSDFEKVKKLIINLIKEKEPNINVSKINWAEIKKAWKEDREDVSEEVENKESEKKSIKTDIESNIREIENWIENNEDVEKMKLVNTKLTNLVRKIDKNILKKRGKRRS